VAGDGLGGRRGRFFSSAGRPSSADFTGHHERKQSVIEKKVFAGSAEESRGGACECAKRD